MSRHHLPPECVDTAGIEIVVGFDQLGYLFADILRGGERIDGTEFGIGVQTIGELRKYLTRWKATIPIDIAAQLKSDRLVRTQDRDDGAGLGAYRWGSAAIRFTRKSRIDHDRFTSVSGDLSTLAQVAREPKGKIEPPSWGRQVDARAFITFVHELTHLFQDLTTGLGHWDSLIRSERKSAAFSTRGERPFKTFGGRAGSGWDSTAAQALADEICPSGFVTDVDDLIETEAVATTLLGILTLPTTPSQQENLKQNLDLIHPLAMTEQYRRLTDLLVKDLAFAFPDGATAMRQRSLRSEVELKRLLKLVLLMCDISLSVPPPDADEDSPSRLRKHPVVRLSFLRKAIAAMSCDRISHVVECLETGNATGAEDALVKASNETAEAIGSREVIYKTWGRRFLRNKSSYPDHEAPLWHVRIRSTEYRLRNPMFFTPKYALFHVLPCVVDVPQLEWDHLVDVYFNSSDTIPGIRSIRSSIRIASALDRITEMLSSKTQVFKCPFAGQHVRMACRGQIDECYSGLGTIKEMPQSKDCIVRNVLRSLGVSPETLAIKDEMKMTIEELIATKYPELLSQVGSEVANLFDVNTFPMDYDLTRDDVVKFIAEKVLLALLVGGLGSLGASYLYDQIQECGRVEAVQDVREQVFAVAVDPDTARNEEQMIEQAACILVDEGVPAADAERVAEELAHTI